MLLVSLSACGSERTTAGPSAADVTTASTHATPASTTSPAPPATAAPAEEPASATTPVASTDPEPRADPGGRLRDRTFRSTLVTEQGRAKELAAGSTVKVQLEARPGSDVVRWRAGCNTSGASVTITADRLDLGPDVGSTAIGCPQQHADQDRWLMDFFVRDPYWRIEGERLVLAVDDTVIEVEEVAPEAFHG